MSICPPERSFQDLYVNDLNQKKVTTDHREWF